LEKDLGEKVVSQLGKDRTVLHIGDISNADAVDRLVDVAVTAFGKLDAVVNNAAAVLSSNIETTDIAFFEKILRINLVAPFALIRAALPYLSKTKGCVLNIGSVNAYCGEPNLLAYSVSKGGLMTLSRNLGDTLHREYGVRVNQINPGWVLTEREIQRKREHGLNDDWHKALPPVYAPAGRIFFPEEIAAAAIYWLADESGPVSGQIVDIEQHPFIGRNPPKDTSTIPSTPGKKN
jgi:NAD(P)-dependent dehydrogenase (short-subunit alcohol dehydrogenase family)